MVYLQQIGFLPSRLNKIFTQLQLKFSSKWHYVWILAGVIVPDKNKILIWLQYSFQPNYFTVCLSFSSPEPKAQGELLWPLDVRRPSVNNLLKRHLLLNRGMDFEIILQEYSLGDPLPKLPKWFRSAEQNGRQS